MSVLNMYNEVRKNFPEITAKADIEHIRLCFEIDPDFAYSWFGSLANVLNSEMSNEIDATKYKELFEFLKHQYLCGSDQIKNCIDVSFTENLFWQVSSEKAKAYWDIFPDVLKDLYIEFHGHPPS